jgi:putative endonuclease
MTFYYTYILKSHVDGNFYTGCTNDLRKRLRQHEAGKVISTVERLPVRLIYYEACLNQQDAFAREKYLKTDMGKRYVRNRLKRFQSLTG